MPRTKRQHSVFTPPVMTNTRYCRIVTRVTLITLFSPEISPIRLGESISAEANKKQVFGTDHLDLCDSGLAHRGVANAKTGDSLLRDGGVEDAVGSELIPQADSAPKNASKCDVLPKQYLNPKQKKNRGRSKAMDPITNRR